MLKRLCVRSLGTRMRSTRTGYATTYDRCETGTNASKNDVLYVRFWIQITNDIISFHKFSSSSHFIFKHFSSLVPTNLRLFLSLPLRSIRNTIGLSQFAGKIIQTCVRSVNRNHEQNNSMGKVNKINGDIWMLVWVPCAECRQFAKAHKKIS